MRQSDSITRTGMLFLFILFSWPFQVDTVFAEDIKTVIPQAVPFCEKAFTAPKWSKSKMKGPFLTLINVSYENEHWAYEGDNPFSAAFPHMEAQAAEDVHCVLCVKQIRRKFGKFDDGAPAYLVKWDVRAVSWPDGKVLVKKTLQNRGPNLATKSGPGPGYTSPPRWPLLGWLREKTGQRNFIYTPTKWGIRVSADGKILVFKSDQKTIYYDVAAWIKSGKEPKDLKLVGVHSGRFSAALSSDGKYMAAIYKDGGIGIWRFFREKPVRFIETSSEFKASEKALALSPDDRILAAATPGKIRLWNLETGSTLKDWPAPENEVRQLAFSPDGKVLAAEYIKVRQEPEPVTETRFWDVETGKPAGEFCHLPTENMDRLPLAWSADGRIIVVKTGDRKIEVLRSGKSIGEYVSGSAATVSPQGGLIALANGNVVSVVNLETGMRHDLSGHFKEVDWLEFLPDASYLLSNSWDWSLRLWDLKKIGETAGVKK